MKSPKPTEIARARDRLNMTQEQAAAVIYTTAAGWRKWESGDRAMHPAFWELFNMKTKGDR